MFYTAHDFGQNKAGNWPQQHIAAPKALTEYIGKSPISGFTNSAERDITISYTFSITTCWITSMQCTTPSPNCREWRTLQGACRTCYNGVAVLSGVISPDGIHWRDIGTVITKGTFDSLNTLYYDPEIGKYRAFFRGWQFHEPSLHLGRNVNE